MIGTVKYFNKIDGNGTIEGENGQEFFFRYTSLPKKNGRFVALQPGQKVSFEIEHDFYFGAEAVYIQLID